MVVYHDIMHSINPLKVIKENKQLAALIALGQINLAPQFVVLADALEC